MFKVLPLKEARFIKLEFLREGWLIQNLKCSFHTIAGHGRHGAEAKKY